jgi:hypothetical protein
MVVTEKSLMAGSDALDVAVDAQIEICRAKDLPTPEQRQACVADIKQTQELTAPYVTAAVHAMRAYWMAKAAGDKAGMAQAARELSEAVSHLPPEFFKGLQGLL